MRFFFKIMLAVAALLTLFPISVRAQEAKKLDQDEFRDAIYKRRIGEVRKILEAHPGWANLKWEHPLISTITPLIIAIYPRDELGLEIAKLLLEKGADINYKVDGGTPIDHTLDPDVAIFLLERGATPTDVSVRRFYLEPKVRKVLVSKHANFNILEDYHGLSLLSDVIKFGSVADIKKEIKVITELIAAGADPNFKNKDGSTALHVVSKLSPPTRDNSTEDGNPMGIVQLLIAKGANVNAKDKDGTTPLHVACGNLETMNYLISKGADVNARTNAGETPLHVVATLNFTTAMATLLIAKGAKVNATDANGETPLQYAVISKHPDLAAVLRKHGGKL